MAMTGLAELAKLIPQAMAAAGNSPRGVYGVIGQQQQMEDRRAEQEQRQRMQAFGREVFGGATPGGATPESIFAAAQKYSIPPGQAMKLASDFMSFRQSRKQMEQGPAVPVSTPVDGGGYIRRSMPEALANQYTADTPGSFVGERYGMPKPEIARYKASADLGIYNDLTGDIKHRAPVKTTGGGGMPKPRMVNVFKRGPEGGVISAPVPADQLGQYLSAGWEFGQLDPAKTPPRQTGGLTAPALFQDMRETSLFNPEVTRKKQRNFLEAKEKTSGLNDNEKAYLETLSTPQEDLTGDFLGILNR